MENERVAKAIAELQYRVAFLEVPGVSEDAAIGSQLAAKLTCGCRHLLKQASEMIQELQTELLELKGRFEAVAKGNAILQQRVYNFQNSENYRAARATTNYRPTELVMIQHPSLDDVPVEEWDRASREEMKKRPEFFTDIERDLNGQSDG
jgi:hypothetical protein